jgi:myo-inositol-1(or 4)-monophosphatase
MEPITTRTGYLSFNTSIALARRSELVLGAIYDPVHGKMFCAEKEKGAFVNGQPTRVSDRAKLCEVLVTYDNCRIKAS